MTEIPSDWIKITGDEVSSIPPDWVEISSYGTTLPIKNKNVIRKDFVPSGLSESDNKLDQKPSKLETVWDYASEVGRQTAVQAINLYKGQSGVSVSPETQDIFDQYSNEAAKE